MLSFRSGYTRIILAGLSLHYMSYHPRYCTILYGVSCLLDALDGHAARALGQTSKFGAVLDMVTDRYVNDYIFVEFVIDHLYPDVQLPVYSVSYLLPIRNMLHFFNSLLPLISVVITCICIGMSFFRRC